MASLQLPRATFCNVGTFFLADNTVLSAQFAQIGHVSFELFVIVGYSSRLHGSIYHNSIPLEIFIWRKRTKGRLIK